MKFLLFIPLSLLVACASLSNGGNQLQPVYPRGANGKTWFTTCNGAVEDWGSCQRKAMKTCPQGYETLDKVDMSAAGGRRELTFGCK